MPFFGSRPGIRGILVRSLALVAIIPFLPAALALYLSFHDEVQRFEVEIQSDNRHVALLARRIVEGLLREVEAEARRARVEPEHMLPPPAPALRWERLDGAGLVVASELEARIGAPCGYEALLQALPADGAVRTARLQGPAARQPSTTVLAATVRPGARLAAVLDPEELSRQLGAAAGTVMDRRIYLVDREGRLVFYPHPDLASRDLDIERNPPVRMLLAGGEGPLRFRSTVSGKERLGYVHRLVSVGWGIVVTADIGSAVLSMEGRYGALISSLAFGLAAAVLIMLATSRRLAGPLLRVTEALRGAGGRPPGPLQLEPGAPGVREIDEVVRAFDDLAARLQQREREVLQAEKTAVLGQLASGIAHEFGTPLNVISGYAQVLRRRAPDDATRAVLDKIIQQTGRLADMIHRILDFARPEAGGLRAVPVADVAARAAEMIHGVRGPVGLVVDVNPATPPVLGTPGLLEHVLLNLLMNAVQACAERPGGVVELSAGPASDGGEPAVFCRVADNGVGIAPENLALIFQPFFTTKAKGQGTGLGLAIVERIVKQLGGRIEVESTPGTRTVFTVWMRPAPAGTEPAAGDAAKVA